MGRLLKVLLVVLSLAAGTAAYAIWVEPYWLVATHRQLAVPVAAPLKIALVGDLHTQGPGRREEKLLQMLEEERPDIILVAGDSRSSFGGDHEMAVQVLSQMRAPLGVWVVRGNWDVRGPMRHALEGREGIRFLINESGAARPDVWIVGLDDESSGTPDLETALQGVPPDSFRVALFHSPVTFDEIAGKVPLALAGHTHGGQVRIPLLPPLWLPYGSGDYVEGWYEKNSSRMYVTRGVGVSILPVRLFCRPEVAFITLTPAQK